MIESNPHKFPNSLFDIPGLTLHMTEIPWPNDPQQLLANVASPVPLCGCPLHSPLGPAIKYFKGYNCRGPQGVPKTDRTVNHSHRQIHFSKFMFFFFVNPYLYIKKSRIRVVQRDLTIPMGLRTKKNRLETINTSMDEICRCRHAAWIYICI